MAQIRVRQQPQRTGHLGTRPAQPDQTRIRIADTAGQGGQPQTGSRLLAAAAHHGARYLIPLIPAPAEAHERPSASPHAIQRGVIFSPDQSSSRGTDETSGTPSSTPSPLAGSARAARSFRRYLTLPVGSVVVGSTGVQPHCSNSSNTVSATT